MKTNKDLIIEPNAAIEGRKYSEEKPWSCKYCYWWGGKKKGCSLKQCHYLLPEKKKAVKTTPCGGCPYGKHVPCIGYCIARLHSEMKGHWMAIAISALIFGIVHFNLPQGIHAFLIGLLLGWMYYRTRSIIPGIVFHWINNTVSYIVVNLMPQCADGKLVDLFNGNERMVIYAVLFSMLIFLPSIFQLNIRMRKAKDTTAE